MKAADQAWRKFGVPVHEGKNVDGKENAEFQGTVLESRSHWLGTSRQRRIMLVASTLRVLAQWGADLTTVERLVGQHGFMHSFRPPLRSIFQDVYVWMEELRSRPRGQGRRSMLSCGAWSELLFSAILAPVAQVSLDSPFCSRLELSDASPGGHGRAWSVFSEGLIEELCRFADARRVYTSLQEGAGEHNIRLDADGKCPLHRVHLPRASHWSKAGRPGGFRHIVIEEAAATVWSLECRIRRPTELGVRLAQGGDNASAVGAFAKGRSSSRALNVYCQKACSLEICGGWGVFHFWVPT